MPLITKILKPEEFNATTVARLLYDTGAFGWEFLTEEERLPLIDKSQFILDGLKAWGIIA